MLKNPYLNSFVKEFKACKTGRKRYRYILPCHLFFFWMIVLSAFSSLYAQNIFMRSKDYFFDCEEGPFKSLVTDINVDTKKDLILLYRRHPTDIVSFAAARVFVNIENGEFRQVGRYELEWAVEDISSGDINGDGYQDFIIGGGDTLYLFLNTGNASFSIQRSIFHPHANALSLADMDKDNDVDLVVVHFRQDTTLSILFNDGKAHFIKTHYYKTNLTPYEYPNDLFVTDLNNDFDPDIIMLNWVNDSTGSVTVLLNNGDGTLRERGKRSLGGGGEPRSLVVADLNNDSYKDLIVANYYPGGISVLFGDSSQTFMQAANYPYTRGYTDIIVGDFDKDGNMDLAVVSDSLRIFRNTTNGVMKLAEVHDVRFRYGVKGEELSISATDIDYDGDIDLITTSVGSCLFSVFLNLTQSVRVGGDRFTSIIGEFDLHQNYPNPFTPETNIEFRIANLSKVKLAVYDLLGKEIISLLESELGAGNYKIVWDGKNSGGSDIPSGVYFYRLQIMNKQSTMFVDTRKILLMRQ